jgi:hypothetical protein
MPSKELFDLVVFLRIQKIILGHVNRVFIVEHKVPRKPRFNSVISMETASSGCDVVGVYKGTSEKKNDDYDGIKKIIINNNIRIVDVNK